MARERQRQRQAVDRAEAAKDAAAGYAVIVLSAVCFVLSLAVLTTIVRFVVGASTGA